MRYLKFVTLFLMALFLCCCSCGSSSHKEIRIGVDPDWYPLDFEELQPHVNGYTEELLLEVSKYAGIEIERIPANWDSLLEGLNERRYEAVLTSLPPYNFNQAKYDFSDNFLDLGPVLVIPATSPQADLNKMSGEVVGVVIGDPALLVLQQHPEIVLRKYSATPELLDAVANGSIEGALLDRLIATNFVRDLYAGKLKVSSGPLDNAGLHLLCLKGRQDHLMHLFNKSLNQLKKKKKLDALQKKWQLD